MTVQCNAIQRVEEDGTIFACLKEVRHTGPHLYDRCWDCKRCGRAVSASKFNEHACTTEEAILYRLADFQVGFNVLTNQIGILLNIMAAATGVQPVSAQDSRIIVPK